MTRASLLGLFLLALCPGALSLAEESAPKTPAAEALKNSKDNGMSLLS